MYYRLRPSFDPEEVGHISCGQADKALYPESISDVLFDQRLPSNHLFEMIDQSEVITPTPVLAAGAKLTDLISGVALGSGLQLMVSDKLKKILESAGHPGIQFFATEVLYKKVRLPGFWIVHPVEPDMAAVDYANSSIEVLGLGATKLRDVEIENFEKFRSMQSQLVRPEMLQITKLVLRPDIDQPMLLLNHVLGGVGYFVSGELRAEIEAAGCTGIVFTKPEERYP